MMGTLHIPAYPPSYPMLPAVAAPFPDDPTPKTRAQSLALSSVLPLLSSTVTTSEPQLPESWRDFANMVGNTSTSEPLLFGIESVAGQTLPQPPVADAPRPTQAAPSAAAPKENHPSARHGRRARRQAAHAPAEGAPAPAPGPELPHQNFWSRMKRRTAQAPHALPASVDLEGKTGVIGPFGGPASPELYKSYGDKGSTKKTKKTATAPAPAPAQPVIPGPSPSEVALASGRVARRPVNPDEIPMLGTATGAADPIPMWAAVSMDGEDPTHIGARELDLPVDLAVESGQGATPASVPNPMWAAITASPDASLDQMDTQLDPGAPVLGKEGTASSTPDSTAAAAAPQEVQEQIAKSAPGPPASDGQLATGGGLTLSLVPARTPSLPDALATVETEMDRVLNGFKQDESVSEVGGKPFEGTPLERFKPSADGQAESDQPKEAGSSQAPLTPQSWRPFWPIPINSSDELPVERVEASDPQIWAQTRSDLPAFRSPADPWAAASILLGGSSSKAASAAGVAGGPLPAELEAHPGQAAPTKSPAFSSLGQSVDDQAFRAAAAGLAKIVKPATHGARGPMGPGLQGETTLKQDTGASGGVEGAAAAILGATAPTGPGLPWWTAPGQDAMWRVPGANTAVQKVSGVATEGAPAPTGPGLPWWTAPGQDEMWRESGADFVATAIAPGKTPLNSCEVRNAATIESSGIHQPD